MEIIHATDENFKDVINDDIVLVDFFASWCGPCRMLSPVLEEISEDRDSIKIVKVDVDKFENLARQYSIYSIPDLKVFKNGKQVNESIGYVTSDALKKLLD